MAVLDAPAPPEHNRTGTDFRRALPRPPVAGRVVDCHVHLLARRHCTDFFAAADHFGIDRFFSMTPIDEAISIHSRFGSRVQFIAIPNLQQLADRGRFDQWLRRLDAFANLGSRVAKIHLAPGTLKRTGLRIESAEVYRLVDEIRARGMVVMTHVGDPAAWYAGKYADDAATLGSRDNHYAAWENLLEHTRGHPWWGAHLGGLPDDLPRLQRILDRFPDLHLDLSATKWIVRELSARRDEARQFIIRNADRLMWGSDQVTHTDRGWDFYASRWWCHRKLFETAYTGPSPIADPDAPGGEPVLNGLALPADVLQKIYRDTFVKFMQRVGVSVD